MAQMKFIIFLILLSGLSAQAFTPAGKPEVPTPFVPAHSNVPASCYVIYETKEIAQSHCPFGTQAVEAHDLWNGGFIGWSCDCDLKNGPHRHSDHHAPNHH